MTESVRSSRRLGPPPAELRWSITAWLAAVAFGVAEAVVRLVLPDPPTADELVARSVIYALVVVLVLALASGRPAVRVAVAVLIGGVGTLSLIMEPVGWLVAGGSPMAFLAAADGATLVVVGLRAAHVVAVLVGLVAMFHPNVNSYMRRRRSGRPELG
jgi:hypothetical protein